MSILAFEIILYVRDQALSRDFYAAALHREPSLDVPGMTEFEICGIRLGLMPYKGIAKLLGSAIAGIDTKAARCELYLTVDDPSAEATHAIAHGANEISPISIRDWGDEVVYLAHPDNHVIAFAKKHTA